MQILKFFECHMCDIDMGHKYFWICWCVDGEMQFRIVKRDADEKFLVLMRVIDYKSPDYFATWSEKLWESTAYNFSFTFSFNSIQSK